MITRNRKRKKIKNNKKQAKVQQQMVSDSSRDKPGIYVICECLRECLW